MSRMSISHIAMLLAIGAIVSMQSLAPRPGLAETLGNGNADGFAAIGISDSDAGSARATAIGGIAIGPDDPPPLKWSDLRYVFDIKEDCNGKEAIQA
jgi:hypothetical protein